MSKLATRVTPEDLLKLPMGTGKRYELIDGELVTMSPAGYRHGKDAARALGIVRDIVVASRLGDVVAAETGFILNRDPYTLRAADVAFVAAGRIPPDANEAGYLELAPDFVIEVISPGDTANEVQERIDDWLRAGTKVVWAVYSALQSVVIWRGLGQAERRRGDEEIDAEPALAGFQCKVSSLFQD